MSDAPNFPDKLLIQLCHYKQKSNWDCGISCVLMVLPRIYRESLLKHLPDVCKVEGFNKSTWTIDLCYLLKKYNVQHKFYTITLGIHPGYSRSSFYRHILSKDEERVKKRFAAAKQNGISVRKKSLKMQQILDHLKNGPAILLTNANLLFCDICKTNRLTSELRKCFPWPITYQGHYVVLCGYNCINNKVYYRNPSLSDRVCVMSSNDLEHARKSYGTDEDIILIYS
ncbi:protein GUCD1 isoform X2 [Agrilus planipennis]|uniref:Protein GUCD1 isoform X2 n=1 Tax=Agrilus planipennis TaxID=224129 RepID=A0A7F5RNE8_AGRPL|nr:protein GUCD1 isoform X2 [Agrilus planipennis]